ncbi:hypothetical protein [Alkalilacustris brevis]|nr:hypothetical protein [Alkalilacustris brevis]
MTWNISPGGADLPLGVRARTLYKFLRSINDGGSDMSVVAGLWPIY